MNLFELKKNKLTILLVAGCVIVSLVIAYLTSKYSLIVAPLSLVLLVGVSVLLVINHNYKLGLIFLLGIGTFMNFINRLIGADLPFGLMFDGIIILIFFFIILSFKRDTLDWRSLVNTSFVFLVILVLYNLLQAFNPNASSLKGWLVSLRDNLSILSFIVCFFSIKTFQDLKLFTKVWMILGVITAFYGMYQEVAGFPGFELNWIYAEPKRFALYFIAGHMRKFSFLSDPATYGIFMAYMSLALMVLALMSPRFKWKALFAFLCLISLASMSFSGTRTAYAVVAIGAVFLIILTIRNRRTLIFVGLAIITAIFVLYAPIYSNRTLIRIRTTFQGSDDPSMRVRDNTRVAYQSYIRNHPIGGGINSSGVMGQRYSPEHELAGVPPDSGFLKTALELGWIGLILSISFFCYVSLRGINNYFSITDPTLKIYTLLYLVPFFAISIGQFTQDSIFQRSIVTLIIGTYAIMERLPSMKNV
jgi:putative inorganic carbon (hco3(-)) transporter